MISYSFDLCRGVCVVAIVLKKTPYHVMTYESIFKIVEDKACAFCCYGYSQSLAAVLNPCLITHVQHVISGYSHTCQARCIPATSRSMQRCAYFILLPIFVPTYTDNQSSHRKLIHTETMIAVQFDVIGRNSK